MSLDYSEAIADIKAQLETIPNIDIISTHGDVTMINGVVKPYIVATFGGPVRANNDRGIVGSRHDTSIVWMVLECVSNDETVARDLKFDALGLLVDFTPTNGGRITLDGGGPRTISKTTTVPLRFVETAMLSFRHNLIWDE